MEKLGLFYGNKYFYNSEFDTKTKTEMFNDFKTFLHIQQTIVKTILPYDYLVW